MVGEHQTCGVRDRTIETNTHIAQSVHDLCIGNGRRVFMIQNDLGRAFDRVKHDVLFVILPYVSVRGVILEGVKMAYNNCSMRLIN